MNGIRIRTISLKPAQIQVEVKTSIPGKVEVQVLDGEQIVLTAKKSSEKRETGRTDTKDPKAVFLLEIPDAELWSPENPHLYRLKVDFGKDQTEEVFGIRTLHWNERDGMTINGERVILRGACVHHDNGLLEPARFRKQRSERSVS